MTTATTRTIYRDSVEYLEVTVTADGVLDAQPVYVSFDRVDWLECVWQGTAGLTRTAAVLGTNANLPTNTSDVYVKVTDNPEVPVVHAGRLIRK
jgi:hypothetical protein